MFYVDIPLETALTSDDDSWKGVATFDTKEEAIVFVQKYFGADDEGRVNLVTQA